MSHLNFSLRAAESQRRHNAFRPRSRDAVSLSSVLWTMFAVMAVAGATFAIVWFA
ncbi:MAG TPA: hypothetical protein VHT03_03955 [Rhizomicrobium sp.]|jgi:hypothetical protein|nr:hypothetical protein [Rhizomicrobium sp.]